MFKKIWFRVIWNLTELRHVLVLGIPQTNYYQEIKNPSFSNQVQQDEWGNNIVVLENSKKEKIKISFDYRPYSLNVKLFNFSLDDYRSQLLSKYEFLFKPNRFINGYSSEVKKIALHWQKEKNLKKIIISVNNYVKNNLIYGNPINGLYSFSQALKNKKVDCGGFSTLAVSLFQALKIPSRLVVGFLLKKVSPLNLIFPLNFTSFQMHAWLEVLLPNGNWLPLDPALEWRRERGLTRRKGGLGFIPADRLVTSFGCDFKIKVKDKIYRVDLLQNPWEITND
jgi:hypothetical protein